MQIETANTFGRGNKLVGDHGARPFGKSSFVIKTERSCDGGADSTAGGDPRTTSRRGGTSHHYYCQHESTTKTGYPRTTELGGKNWWCGFVKASRLGFFCCSSHSTYVANSSCGHRAKLDFFSEPPHSVGSFDHSSRQISCCAIDTPYRYVL
jgi:hypothetical protein